MEPKFQSTFIPKGNFAAQGNAQVAFKPAKERSFLGFIAFIIFLVAIVATAGVFGYAWYLSYDIGKMGTDLETSRASVEPETVNSLIHADERLSSTKKLLSTHTVLSPLFDFLEANTLKTVRFNEFSFVANEKGYDLVLKGEAASYQALALESALLSGSPSIKNPVFSDLRLNNQGNVTFSFTAQLDPKLIAYASTISKMPAASTTPAVLTSTSTSTSATTTQSRAATTTPLRQGSAGQATSSQATTTIRH